MTSHRVTVTRGLPLGRGRGKTYPRLPPQKRAKREKRRLSVFKVLAHTANIFRMKTTAYLGHLNDIGELGKAGNGNHIMVGFQLCTERANSLKSQLYF